MVLPLSNNDFYGAWIAVSESENEFMVETESTQSLQADFFVYTLPGLTLVCNSSKPFIQKTHSKIFHLHFTNVLFLHLCLSVPLLPFLHFPFSFLLFSSSFPLFLSLFSSLLPLSLPSLLPLSSLPVFLLLTSSFRLCISVHHKQSSLRYQYSKLARISAAASIRLLLFLQHHSTIHLSQGSKSWLESCAL